MNIGEMLSYRRAHDSEGEAQFIARYIAPVAAPVAAPDGAVHCYTVSIGQSRNCFTAHTDSVHNRQNPEPRQAVAFDSARGEYFVADETQRDCLGADNAAGCYLLLRMIQARVPGLYVFFRGEERGGIGSSWVAKNRPDIFLESDCAIAFDRRGTNSIITEMACGKTCSDEFAQSLADALMVGHRPDNTGSFTDTANLAGIIAECTNVSCGYDMEHSSDETLDAEYLESLADACIASFSGSPQLSILRQPGDFSTGWDSDFGMDAWHSSLEDMTDADIREIAELGDPDTLYRLMRDARDELRWGDYGT